MGDRLEAKRILVTGAGSGIGQGIALRVAREGAACVAVLDIDPDAAATTVDLIASVGGTATPVTCDITNEAAVSAAFADAVTTMGGLDGVVANAAVQLIGRDAPIHELELDVLRTTLEVNVVGTVLTAKYAARRLLDGGAGGSIVITGSPTGLVGQRTYTAYSTSKAATHGLARIMASDLAADGIRVNVVVPGFTTTPLVAPLLADPAATAELLALIPMGRPGTPDDAAAMAAFLLSDDASYATGAMFVVDGGMTAV